jgi:hypothetical protein
MFELLVQGYPWVLTLVGLLGLWLGLDRTFNRKENESLLLRALALVGGVLMLALPSFIVLASSGSENIAPVTLLIMLVLGLAMLARALRKVPITFLVVGGLGVGALFLALQLQDSSFGGTVPMTVVAVVMLALLIGVFAASFAFESTLDIFLGILGWGPLVAAFGLLAVIQGLLVGAGITGPGGLVEVL